MTPNQNTNHIKMWFISTFHPTELSLHGTIIYNMFIWVKCLVTYAYMSLSFGINFMIKDF
jgi:hypothetical protein